jgi:hypothetical protein
MPEPLVASRTQETILEEMDAEAPGPQPKRERSPRREQPQLFSDAG